MICIGIGLVVTTFYVILLAGTERGFGIPRHTETIPGPMQTRRPSGEERMG